MAFWNSNLVWAAVQQLIRWRFPQVKHLTGEALQTWLATPGRSQPLLLDTRTQAEYNVSHLPGAIWVDPQLPDVTAIAIPNRQTPIVTYCSVGYRSAAIAQRLTAAGYSQVSNLEGSIFQWANQGRTVYCHDRSVQQVHPYSALWGRLLNPQLHADYPDG